MTDPLNSTLFMTDEEILAEITEIAARVDVLADAPLFEQLSQADEDIKFLLSVIAARCPALVNEVRR